jgi:uncharacterized protein YkwD
MCNFASIRVKQIETDYSHSGFNQDARNYLGNGYIGENIDIASNDQIIVTAWINSPDHRSNILSSHYTDTCVATAKYNYAVQEFASF